MRRLRWVLFTRDERLVIEQALRGKTPYIGGVEPYGLPYSYAVELSHRLRAELQSC
jgi:hypothetical protein